MVALFFSGGGTRSAAFSYGVLRELAATPVVGGRRMLDDVATINAVSGGSFTAAYYCLYGDRIFTDYERLFLKRDVQGALCRRFLRPGNVVRLWSPWFGRGDLAAEYYDELLFHGATFGDLARRGGTRPFLAVNATNIATSTALPFTQDHFDLIGSDLNRFPISRAVAASSAAPLFFAPIVLKNYANQAAPADSAFLRPVTGFDAPVSFQDALAETNRSYRDVQRHPYIYLMDGGLSDNLSLRNLLDRVMLFGGWNPVLEGLRSHGIRRLAIIVANASVDVRQDWAQRGEAPGFVTVTRALTGSSMNRANRETVALVESSLALWQAQRAGRPGEGRDEPAVYFIGVDFHCIADPAEKAWFGSLPTNFKLPPETVDRVVAAGGRLLRESPAFQKLIQDLAEDRPTRADRLSALRSP
jgi:NTE family protein